MDIELTKQKIEAERLLGEMSVQLPVHAEALISGAGRGDAEVLLADASARITRLEAEADRAVMEGEISCQAAYRLRGENNARSVNARGVISHVFDVKGALPTMNVRGDCVIDDVSARYENGHMVFDVSVTAHAHVTALAVAEIITDISPREEIELKKEELVSSKLAAENTQRLVVSEKTALPAQLDARYAIMEWADTANLQYRPEPGGVRITGSVAMETLVSGGGSQRPAALIKYQLPVDRYMEMPEWLLKDVSVEGRVLRASAEVEQAENGEDSTLSMEAEIELSVLAEGKDCVSAVTDAYASGERDAEVCEEEIEMCLSRGKISFEEPFRASVILPQGAGAVGSVCAVKTRSSLADVEVSGGRSTISGVVNAQVIYTAQSDDALLAVQSDLPFSVSIALPVESLSSVRIRAVNAEGNALMSDRVEIRCMLEVTAQIADRRRVKTVSAILPGGEIEKRHGCVIVWPGEQDDAWSLAKRYRIPVEKIKNAASEGVSVGKPMVLRI